jgi:hypothetical protein
MSQPNIDHFADGKRCIIPVLRPKGDGWTEVPGANRFSLGFPARAFSYKDGLFVISAVEVASDKDGKDRGFEYHISISRPISPGLTSHCSSNEARWVLDQFGLEGAEEDNHVPHGKVRNFWRPVAEENDRDQWRRHVHHSRMARRRERYRMKRDESQTTNLPLPPLSDEAGGAVKRDRLSRSGSAL